jgi:hypothetical protein
MRREYKCKIRGVLYVDAESEESAWRLAYEALANVKLGTRKNPIKLTSVHLNDMSDITWEGCD